VKCRDEIADLETKHHKEMHELRTFLEAKYQDKIADLETKHHKEMRELRTFMEAKYQDEIAELKVFWKGKFSILCEIF
jgi:flagellar biosynthesis chaperone FliJ